MCGEINSRVAGEIVSQILPTRRHGKDRQTNGIDRVPVRRVSGMRQTRLPNDPSRGYSVAVP